MIKIEKRVITVLERRTVWLRRPRRERALWQWCQNQDHSFAVEMIKAIIMTAMTGCRERGRKGGEKMEGGNNRSCCWDYHKSGWVTVAAAASTINVGVRAHSAFMTRSLSFLLCAVVYTVHRRLYSCFLGLFTSVYLPGNEVKWCIIHSCKEVETWASCSCRLDYVEKVHLSFKEMNVLIYLSSPQRYHPFPSRLSTYFHLVLLNLSMTSPAFLACLFDSITSEELLDARIDFINMLIPVVFSRTL